MNLQDFFTVSGSSYEEIHNRISSDSLLKKFLRQFLEDTTFKSLEQAISKKEYKNEFIENISARRYVTKKYGYKDVIFTSETLLIKELDSIIPKKEKAGIDFLRLIINIPENYEKAEFLINLLNERFKFRTDIKIEIVNGYVEKKRQVNKEEVQEVFEKYDFIFDKNEEDERKLSYFIREKNNKEMSPEQIKKYLSFKAIELLQEKKGERS